MASGFVTETEIEDRKRVRQEEWEKVRKPEDPEAAPEEPVDNRSLWERLEEQKQKKQMDWDEEHKFKNQFRGLNDDEVIFLDKIDDFRTEVERKRMLDEEKELEDFERRQEELREKQLLEKLEMEKKVVIKKPVATSNQAKNSQLKLLAGAVKRKSEKDNDLVKKPKSDTTPDKQEVVKKDESKAAPPAPAPTSLLGLADYGSDSENDSDS